MGTMSGDLLLSASGARILIVSTWKGPINAITGELPESISMALTVTRRGSAEEVV